MYNLFQNLPESALRALDVFFFVFHSLFTLFNLICWIPKKTRIIHLITMSLTAFSWFVLGIFYGFGFCFCTQWHWDVRQLLGYNDESSSYIHLLLTEIFNRSFDEAFVIEMTKWGFIFIVIGMISVQVYDITKKLNSRGRKNGDARNTGRQ